MQTTGVAYAFIACITVLCNVPSAVSTFRWIWAPSSSTRTTTPHPLPGRSADCPPPVVCSPCASPRSWVVALPWGWTSSFGDSVSWIFIIFFVGVVFGLYLAIRLRAWSCTTRVSESPAAPAAPPAPPALTSGLVKPEEESPLANRAAGSRQLPSSPLSARGPVAPAAGVPLSASHRARASQLPGRRRSLGAIGSLGR